MNLRVVVLCRLALRNVRRQARRSLLTASAMVIGLALLVFSRGLADGAHEDWIEAGVRLGKGHVTVQSPRFKVSGAIEDHLSSLQHAGVVAALGRPDIARDVLVSAPRVEVPALANTPSAAVPVAVIGVDPSAEPAFATLDEKLVEGRYLTADDRLHAYVGTKLAERLDLRLNSRLVLTAQDVAGEIAGQLVRVTGIFRMGIPEIDEVLVHIPLRTAQEWLGLRDGITSYAIVLESSRTVDRVIRGLDAALHDGSDNVAVLGWTESMPDLYAAVKVDDYGDYIFHGILFAIVALAIVNTILMSVLYRTREFGVLRALGLTKGHTAGLVFLEGLLLTAVSGLVGMVLGVAVTWGIFRNGLDFSFLLENDLTAAGVVIDPVLVPEFRVMQLVQSIGFIVVIGLAASLYPAYRATRIDVAESMKFEA